MGFVVRRRLRGFCPSVCAASRWRSFRTKLSIFLRLPAMIWKGTVALRANDAEPASIGVMAERQSRGAHIFTMHLNTRFSAHLMLRVGSRGSMQQCPFESWTEVLGSERLTGATLDRLTHRCRIIETKGESCRLTDAKARTRRTRPATTLDEAQAAR